MSKVKLRPSTDEPITRRKQSSTAITQQAAVWVVHRLPLFAEDGRADLQATSEYCGEVSPSPDSVSEVRQRFGSGYFRITERSETGRIRSRWVVQVPEVGRKDDEAETDEPDSSERETESEGEGDGFDLETFRSIIRHELLAATRPQPAQNSTVQAAQSPAQALKDSLDVLAQFEAMLTKFRPSPSPPPAIAAMSEPDPTTAVLRFIASDPESVLSVAGKLRGLFSEDGPALQDTPQTNWADVAATAIETLGPFVGPLVQKWATPARSHESQEHNPTAPISGQATPIPAQQAHGGVPQDAAADTPESLLLSFVIQSFAQHSPIKGVAAAIEHMAERDPQLEPIVDLFLNTKPQDCLDWLAKALPQARDIANAPGAPAWVESLQSELQDESDNLTAAASL